MKLLKRTYNIHADLEHVYTCFSDLDYIIKEINRLKDNNEVKVTKKGNEIIFERKSKIFSLKELEKNRPLFYKSEVIPLDEKILRFGKATINCMFSKNGENTQVIVTVTSSKTPGVIWRIFIRAILLIFKFQSRHDEKKFIKAIEKCT